MTSRRVSLTVNDQPWTGDVPVTQLLYDFLRGSVGLTGTKRSCDQQVCGACAVLVDGQPVSSCTYLAFEADGQSVETIEGLAGEGGTLSSLQRAFVECGAIQCGFCTPGQVMTALAYLRHARAGGREDPSCWFDGNLCRCGTYPAIRAAVLRLLPEDA